MEMPFHPSLRSRARTALLIGAVSAAALVPAAGVAQSPADEREVVAVDNAYVVT